MTRRGFGTALAGASMAGAAQRPNILFLSTDAHCGRVMGCNGHAEVRTPNLDRLAAMGVNFRNAYSCSTPCAPARAALMTGRYASDVGSYCNATWFDGRVPTFGNCLRDAGYSCWATGKLDLEGKRDYGFREVDTKHSHSTDPDMTALFRRPMCYRVRERALIGAPPRKRSADAGVVKAGLEFLRNPGRGPWLAFLGLTGTISLAGSAAGPPASLPVIPEGYLERRPLPFQVLADYHGISTPIPEERVRAARAGYYASVAELDANVGRLIAEVDLDKTLVVFTSDHGQMLGEHGLWFYKSLLEGSVRVPLILAGAGLPRGKVVETPVSHADIMPALLEAAGAPAPAGLRGHSLLQFPTAPVFAECHCEGSATGSFMIREGDWKYIHFSWGDPLLFNLKADPDEYRNLAGQRETAEVERGLHGILTSRVDPDAVTRRAFEEQERRLERIVRSHTREQFYERLVDRMGKMQARALADKYYTKVN